MKVVIDSNVLVSALRSSRGASYKSVSLLPSGKFLAAAEKIADEGIACTLLFESPRDYDLLEKWEGRMAPEDVWASIFYNRDYKGELQAFRDVVYNAQDAFKFVENDILDSL